MRDLVTIIDTITRIAPDLADNFRSLRSSVLYTAPEIMGSRWNEAAAILNTYALDHSKADEIAKVFRGESFKQVRGES